MGDLYLLENFATLVEEFKIGVGPFSVFFLLEGEQISEDHCYISQFLTG